MTGSHSCPAPTASPTAAVIQTPAAVVRPSRRAALAQLEDGAGADEADAGDETLYDARERWSSEDMTEAPEHARTKTARCRA